MDIITTSTRRSNMFRKTFDSFEKRLFKSFLDHRLVVNIDPIGSEKDNNPMLKEISGFFGNNLKINMPDYPDFMSAYMWAWKNGESEYLFQLEDDWMCLREFDLDKMLTIMDDNKDLGFLRLSSWGTETDYAKQWNRRFSWNDSFFECPHELKTTMGFCGHPGIFRKKFINQLIDLLEPFGGPEKQINNGRNPHIKHLLLKWRFGVFAQPNEEPGVKDMGRKWRKENGFSKDSATRFRRWTSKNS